MKPLAALSLVLLAAAAPPLTAAELVHARWHGSVLGRGAEGGFLLLAGTNDVLRLEIGDETTTERADLLALRGRGWTVVATPDGGTRNPWGQEWRSLEPRLGALLRAGAGVLRDPPPVGQARRLVISDPGALPGLRERLQQRAAGRGGRGEVLQVRREDGDRLVFGSSRRPGALRLERIRREPVPEPEVEAFVPLWPLSATMDTTGVK